eukprot:11005284-Alexandrium_andersonii.AAC.1
MSASLVGSEMCIRDRCCRPPQSSIRPTENNNASSGRSLNCTGPGTAATFAPDAPEGCILCRCFAQIPNLSGIEG